MQFTSPPQISDGVSSGFAAADGSALGLFRTPRQTIRTIGFICVVVMLVAVPIKIRAQDLSEDGFATPNSVEGTLAATADRQSEGGFEGYQGWKKELESRIGLSFGFDNQVQYLGTNSDRTPSDAASNVFRFYGTWTATGRGTPNDGALVFKLENRSAIGGYIPTQLLGPSLGYAGVFSSTYSDSDWVLTNLYWRQRFANGRGSFVIGHVDTYDYVNVNSHASPWVAFTNLEFEQQSTYAGPGQGLGAAIRWRIDDNWLILAGVANANADASDPINSAQKLFDTGETFKHIGISWSPDWDDRFNQSVQLNLWQVDERTDAGVPSGLGASLAVNARFGSWTPFFRAGYADGGGRSLDRSVSIGTGYDARGGKDMVGIGLNWGRAPGNSRDQYSLEAFYRYDFNDFLQITPSIQYVVDPANDLTTDDILVGGVRLRVAF